jgi:heme-degrading monooxygenase HmoA
VSAFHLAQVNIGRLLAPVDDPRIDDFRNNLARINALADAQPGFVWRLTGAGDDATDIRPIEADPLLAINVSLWESPEHLAAFVYRSEHREFVRRRHEWFQPATAAILALWWVRAGDRPEPAACVERLFHLRANGPTAHAFDFRHRFAAPAAEAAA